MYYNGHNLQHRIAQLYRTVIDKQTIFINKFGIFVKTYNPCSHSRQCWWSFDAVEILKDVGYNALLLSAWSLFLCMCINILKHFLDHFFAFNNPGRSGYSYLCIISNLNMCRLQEISPHCSNWQPLLINPKYLPHPLCNAIKKLFTK